MEPFRWARLKPRSGGRGGLRQGDCMTKDRSGRLTGHIGHKGYSNPSGRKHAHILKVWEVRSKKLGHSAELSDQATKCELHFLHHGGH